MIAAVSIVLIGCQIGRGNFAHNIVEGGVGSIGCKRNIFVDGCYISVNVGTYKLKQICFEVSAVIDICSTTSEPPRITDGGVPIIPVLVTYSPLQLSWLVQGPCY